MRPNGRAGLPDQNRAKDAIKSGLDRQIRLDMCRMLSGNSGLTANDAELIKRLPNLQVVHLRQVFLSSCTF